MTYPFHTHTTGGKIEVSTGIISDADVEQYYKSYGRGTYIWHKSWEDAYAYCMKENKRQTDHLKKSLNQYKEEVKNLKIEKKIRALQKEIK